MPYNPQYDEQTFSADELATSTKQNKVRNNIKHNQLYKPQLSPSAPTNPKVKIAPGKKSGNITGGNNSITVDVVFANDCIWPESGWPGFSNTPVITIGVIGGIPVGPGAFILNHSIINSSNTGFTIRLQMSSGSAENVDFMINFIAIGN